MRFGSDPSQSALIRWVWAREGAQDLGIPSVFTSRNWDQWTNWPPLGEINDEERRYNSDEVFSSQPGTRGPCGSPTVWVNGWEGTIPPQFPRNMFGVALCCGGLLAPWGAPTLGLIPQAVSTWPFIPVTKIPFAGTKKSGGRSWAACSAARRCGQDRRHRRRRGCRPGQRFTRHGPRTNGGGYSWERSLGESES